MPLLSGIGIGMLFHSTHGAITNAMPEDDLAGVTGAFFLVRFIGSTAGLVSGSFIGDDTASDRRAIVHR
jgi:hypothetical protein